ncbi:YibE/F family protein [Limosilactobacillus sp. STM2_1]|uniref:YibE/F family protein n=1 Tax=Limosilactobacillus rudii TaxID=2759755 RepID=A0A7W3ULY2_9LACO|nr:YibE/F family protein [Limosilactobacillus rudii]MBB1079944.1 YibE/F family protein [Limosilactobacillus rudii]MBB1098023.1 YibE/F family protein [Limosilactobacillus rudii]MCD7135092.1 YibE/F family protein [Limosilactobacillus rudii]
MTKQFWTKEKTWLLLVLIVIGVGALIFTSHNERFYRQPIARVISEKTVGQRKVKDQFDNVDHQYNQQLRVRMMNGKQRGQVLTVQNTYSDSQPMDQRYRIGDDIFLTQLRKQHGHLSANVDGYKRDTVIVFLLWLVILMLLLLMGHAGLLALISVVINVVLFLVAIEIDLKQSGQHIMLLFSILAVIFTFISLLLVLGFSKRMLATFAATIIGTFVALGVSILVFNWTHERGVFYESMEYVTQVPRPLFLAETLLGSLGAVMDESSDIIATLFELKQLNPQVTRKQLFISGRNVGKSIMGPLVNVLFLIFMVDTFTGSLLYIKNGNSWGYTYAMNMSLGTIQSLISGIGIVLSVPLVSLFGALLLGKGTQK